MVWCSDTPDSFGRSLPSETVHLWLVKRLILVLPFLDSPKFIPKNFSCTCYPLGPRKPLPFGLYMGKSIMQVRLVTFKCWRSQQIVISRIAFQESHWRISGPTLSRTLQINGIKGHVPVAFPLEERMKRAQVILRNPEIE